MEDDRRINGVDPQPVLPPLRIEPVYRRPNAPAVVEQVLGRLQPDEVADGTSNPSGEAHEGPVGGQRRNLAIHAIAPLRREHHDVPPPPPPSS